MDGIANSLIELFCLLSILLLLISGVHTSVNFRIAHLQAYFLAVFFSFLWRAGAYPPIAG